MISDTPITRRAFVAGCGASALAATGANVLPRALHADELSERIKPRLGKAEPCIFIWLGGGAAQIDTFDPKEKGDGRKKPGSYYDAIDTAVPGVQVCEHLHRLAPLMDRCVLLRTVHHKSSMSTPPPQT